MRILVVTNLYPPHYQGGYEVRCAQVAEALRASGHDVCVLTSTHGLPLSRWGGLQRRIDLVNANFAYETVGRRVGKPPIKGLLPLRRGRSTPPALFFVRLGARHKVSPHRSRANETQQKMPLRIGTRLQAGLKILFQRRFGGAGNRPRVLNRGRQRRFAVNVFARL
jgi:hypothetical protein